MSRYSHDSTFYTLSLSKKNTLATPIAAAPALELVASDGTPFTDARGIWRVFLTDGGRMLKFGLVMGTRILVK